MNKTITVCLMISADGQKYPAMIIFSEVKGLIPSSVRESLIIPTNFYVTSNKKFLSYHYKLAKSLSIIYGKRRKVTHSRLV